MVSDSSPTCFVSWLFKSLFSSTLPHGYSCWNVYWDSFCYFIITDLSKIYQVPKRKKPSKNKTRLTLGEALGKRHYNSSRNFGGIGGDFFRFSLFRNIVGKNQAQYLPYRIENNDYFHTKTKVLNIYGIIIKPGNNIIGIFCRAPKPFHLR